MPDRVKEKLVGIVCEGMEDGCVGHCNHPPCFQVERVVNALLGNGVTVQGDKDINVPSKWISVTERLPQEDELLGALCEVVQVLLDDGTVTVGWCNRGLKCWYYMPIQATNFVGHDYDKTPVVAWQPLAQPQKGN